MSSPVRPAWSSDRRPECKSECKLGGKRCGPRLMTEWAITLNAPLHSSKTDRRPFFLFPADKPKHRQSKIGADLVKQDQRSQGSLRRKTVSTPQRIRISNLRFRSSLIIAGVNVVERLAAVSVLNRDSPLVNHCRLWHFYTVCSGAWDLKWYLGP